MAEPQHDQLLSVQRAAGNVATGAFVEHMSSESEARRRSSLLDDASKVPVRRMVAVASVDYTKENDTLVLNNLDYARGHFGDPVGDFVSHRKFSHTKPGDRVGIVAHGAPGQIGANNYSGTQVADFLTDQRDSIDKGVTSIVLYSCNAGMDQQDAKPSLVHELSTELAARGYEIGVEGLKGIGFGFAGVGERTTTGDEATGDAAWFGTKKRLLKEQPFQGVIGEAGEFFAVDELLKVAGRLSKDVIDGMSVEDKAKEVSRIMAPFWRRVDEEIGTGAQFTSLYAPPQGWLRVLTYAAGGGMKTVTQDLR